jgi:diacylglycerol kinase family enzyme
MDVLLFHNAKAGDGDHARGELLSVLRAAGMSVRYCSTMAKGFPDKLEEPADLFIVAGGDGTVAKVLRKMPDRRIPVAILPLGTANNIARSLGISGEVEDIVAGWKQGEQQAFDIGLAIGPWGRKRFIEAAGIGCLAESMARVDSVQIERADGVKHGRDRFRKVLSEAKPIPVKLSIDGRVTDTELLMLEILNIRYAGPSLALGAADGHGDGLLDLITIHADQRADMLAWLGVAKPNVPPPLTVQQGSKIIMSWDGAPLRLDDSNPKGAERAAKVTFELESETASVLLPASAVDAAGGRSKRRAAA